MNILNLFKPKKQKDADKLYKIYKNVNINKKIETIAQSEYDRMLIYAKKTAVNGQTSFSFDIEIDDDDMVYFNQIIYSFINILTKENFKYSRHLLNKQKRFTIYFTKDIIKK